MLSSGSFTTLHQTNQSHARAPHRELGKQPQPEEEMRNGWHAPGVVAEEEGGERGDAHVRQRHAPRRGPAVRHFRCRNRHRAQKKKKPQNLTTAKKKKSQGKKRGKNLHGPGVSTSRSMAASLDGTRLYADDLSFHRIGADRRKRQRNATQAAAGGGQSRDLGKRKARSIDLVVMPRHSPRGCINSGGVAWRG